jgi:hypothetical protein
MPRRPTASAEYKWDDVTLRLHPSPLAAAKVAQRAAACARIAALVDSQHQFVREHLLGVTTALERLAAIHDEIGKLNAELS